MKWYNCARCDAGYDSGPLEQECTCDQKPVVVSMGSGLLEVRSSESFEAEYQETVFHAPADVRVDVWCYFHADKKISGIKAIRAVTGWGLKESKDWYEAYIQPPVHSGAYAGKHTPRFGCLAKNVILATSGLGTGEDGYKNLFAVKGKMYVSLNNVYLK